VWPKVREVIGQDRITGTLKNDQQFATIPVPGDNDLPKLLQDNGVQYAGKAQEEPNLLLYILAQSLPFLLILGVASSRCARCRRAADRARWASASPRPRC
jgi:cell division protease FtsH